MKWYFFLLGALFLMGGGSLKAHFQEIWEGFHHLKTQMQCFHPTTFDAFENLGVFDRLETGKRRSASVSLRGAELPHVVRSSSAPLVMPRFSPSVPELHAIHPKFFFDQDKIESLSLLTQKFLAQVKEHQDLPGTGKSFFGLLKSIIYTARRVMGLKPCGEPSALEWTLNQPGIMECLKAEKRRGVRSFLEGQKESNQKGLPFISLSPKSYQDKEGDFFLHVFEVEDLKRVFGDDFVEHLSGITGNLKDALEIYQQKAAEYEGDESTKDDIGSSEEGAA